MSTLELTEEQTIIFDVVTQAKRGIFVLDAPAGRGKSVLARAIFKHFQRRHRCLAVAHTHRAVSNLELDPSGTICREFGFKDFIGPNAKFEMQPRPSALQAKLIVIDEMGIIALGYARKLCSFIQEHPDRLYLLLGDSTQLPPIGWTHPQMPLSLVFAEMKLPVFHLPSLTQNLRAKDGCPILRDYQERLFRAIHYLIALPSHPEKSEKSFQFPVTRSDLDQFLRQFLLDARSSSFFNILTRKEFMLRIEQQSLESDFLCVALSNRQTNEYQNQYFTQHARVGDKVHYRKDKHFLYYNDERIPTFSTTRKSTDLVIREVHNYKLVLAHQSGDREWLDHYIFADISVAEKIRHQRTVLQCKECRQKKEAYLRHLDNHPYLFSRSLQLVVCSSHRRLNNLIHRPALYSYNFSTVHSVQGLTAESVYFDMVNIYYCSVFMAEITEKSETTGKAETKEPTQKEEFPNPLTKEQTRILQFLRLLYVTLTRTQKKYTLITTTSNQLFTRNPEMMKQSKKAKLE